MEEVLVAHGSLHERVLTMSSILSNELNSEFVALFKEKKYKELKMLAERQQTGQLIDNLAFDLIPFCDLANKAVQGSNSRRLALENPSNLSSSSKTSSITTLAQAFDFLSKNTL